MFTNERLSSVCKYRWKKRQRQMEFLSPLFSKGSKTLTVVLLHPPTECATGDLKATVPPLQRKLFWIMLYVVEAKNQNIFFWWLPHPAGLPNTASRQVSLLSNQRQTVLNDGVWAWLGVMGSEKGWGPEQRAYRMEGWSKTLLFRFNTAFWTGDDGQCYLRFF